MDSEWKTAEEAAQDRAQRVAERHAAVGEVPLEVRCWFCACEAQDKELWIHFRGKPRLPLCADCQVHAKNIVYGLLFGAKMLEDAYSKKTRKSPCQLTRGIRFS